MEERTIVWRITAFLLFYVVFSIFIDVLFSSAMLQIFKYDVTGQLIFGLSAFATVYFLKKKSVVKEEKINRISTELAVVTFLLPFAIGVFFSTIGFLWGANYFAEIFSAWQQVGIGALVIRIWNQIINAAIVFTIIKVFI